MAVVILVYPDTNALHGDPLLIKSRGQQLVQFARDGVCRLHLSPVVMAELERMSSDGLGGEHDSLVTRIKDMGQRYRTAVDDVLASLEAAKLDAQQQFKTGRSQLSDSPGVAVEAWPTSSVQEVVERELRRRRPFIDKENVGTIGHRDTIIWLGLIAMAKDHTADIVLFVTKDKGFLAAKGGGLHLDLEADLARCGIDVSRVKVMPDLFSVINLLHKRVEADQVEVQQLRAAADAAVRQALHEYNEELLKLQWGWEFDPRDGGLAEPEINVGLPPQMENVTVSCIESEFDLAIEPGISEDGKPFYCTYRLEISFDGSMSKSDWYVGDYSGLDLWDADLNDHYVSVEAHRLVELTAEVTYDSEVEQARVHSIVNSCVAGDSPKATFD